MRYLILITVFLTLFAFHSQANTLCRDKISVGRELLQSGFIPSATLLFENQNFILHTHKKNLFVLTKPNKFTTCVVMFGKIKPVKRFDI